MRYALIAIIDFILMLPFALPLILFIKFHPAIKNNRQKVKILLIVGAVFGFGAGLYSAPEVIHTYNIPSSNLDVLQYLYKKWAFLSVDRAIKGTVVGAIGGFGWYLLDYLATKYKWMVRT
ncbi:MAG: hypothetical protein AB1489_37450 [Acidobacteriota bacterium]